MDKITNNLTIEQIEQNFTDEMYISYLKGDLKLKDMLKTLNCSDYAFKKFAKARGILSRREYNQKTINHNFFDKIDSPEKAYVLGFYIADGYITKSGVIGFSLNIKDEPILIKFKNLLCPNANIHYSDVRINKAGIKTNEMCRLAFTSKHMVDTLNQYGIGYNKTYLNKSITNLVPRELMWHFIRGYFDGDGMIGAYNVSKKHKCKNGELRTYNFWNYNFTIISHDKQILEDILDFYKSEGIDAILYPEIKGNYLVGTHSFEQIKKVYPKLYDNADIYLERKYEKFKEIIENTEVIKETKNSLTP